MKIGVITHWDSLDNYGQQLQCYALQHYLRSQGHEAFLIRYNPKPKRPALWRRIAYRQGIKRIYCWIRCPKEKREARRESTTSTTWEKQRRELAPKREFEAFRAEHLHMTERIYCGVEELRACPPGADMYICGSDQVWSNPLADSDTAACFLDFGDKSTRRVAYAASIGRELKPEELDAFARYLRPFERISVREKQAAELCRQLGYKDALVTIDPTLLHPRGVYDRLTAPNQSIPLTDKPYVFIYVLNIKVADEIRWQQVDEMAQRERLDVKVVASSGWIPAHQVIPGHKNLPATIPQWLSLVRDARVVVTTSFHGVVFCLVFHRPFYAVLLQGRLSKQNDRLKTLLSGVGLSDRLVDGDWQKPFLSNDDIDWDAVDQRLNELRKTSVDFLELGAKTHTNRIL